MSSKLFGIIPRKTLDLPDTATERINTDEFLSTLYTDEVNLIRSRASLGKNTVIIEIGAAGGNTKMIWPEVCTTDVRPSVGVDLVMRAESIERESSTVDLVFGLDALHHVRDPEAHFSELVRVLKPGGQAFYIEPNWNLFSKICFKYLLKYLHPEPYDTKKKQWTLNDPDPMMGNQSQAFNIFIRDADVFQERYPQLEVEILDPIKGIAFLLSGGVHTRLPIPSKIIIAIYHAENRSTKWLNAFGLGRLIRISKPPTV